MGKKKGKSKQVEPRQLVRAALLMAIGGAAVCGLALAARAQVAGILAGVLLVIAVIGALYAAMWIGGAAMFLFFDQLLSGDPERAVNWYWRLVWLVVLISVPLSGYLLEFDKDQWIWGTGSTVAGIVIALVVLYGRPKSKGSNS
ncbi:hypothetical protein [Aeromicrobium sp.]|uniref:hypothetical protein n=1 Tax=Aeromicrobium sp. TaxID=1871063 RepID=UPI002FC5A38C